MNSRSLEKALVAHPCGARAFALPREMIDQYSAVSVSLSGPAGSRCSAVVRRRRCHGGQRRSPATLEVVDSTEVHLDLCSYLGQLDQEPLPHSAITACVVGRLERTISSGGDSRSRSSERICLAHFRAG